MQQAQAIVRRLGFAGLERMTEDLASNVEQYRALIKSREAQHTSIEKANIFRPKGADNVVVSERFVAKREDIPPQLLALYQAGKRFEAQVSAFAQPSDVLTLYTDGLLNEMEGRHDAALDFFKKAAQALEHDRRSLRDERTRGTIMEDRISIYYATVQQLLERRRHAEAFEMLERSRSRALTDLLASRTSTSEARKSRSCMPKPRCCERRSARRRAGCSS